jgi:hypothetical protein
MLRSSYGVRNNGSNRVTTRRCWPIDAVVVSCLKPIGLIRWAGEKASRVPVEGSVKRSKLAAVYFFRFEVFLSASGECSERDSEARNS